MGRLVTLGELLVEFVSIGRDGRPAPLTRAPGRFAGPFPSGAPAIFIDQAARMGTQTAIAGAIGADLFGDTLMARLTASGVDTSAIRRAADLSTGTAHVGYKRDGSRDFVFHLAGSAADALADGAETALLEGADVLHISGATFGSTSLRAAALSAMHAAHKAGVALSFDPNIRPELFHDEAISGAIERAIDQAQWLFPSEDDLRTLRSDADPVDTARGLASARRTVVLTRGDRGARLFHGTSETIHPAYEVEPVDPTGAGDAFAATFLAAMMAGSSPEITLELATAAGAHAVTALGPMEGNAGRDTIEAMANLC